MAKKKVAKVSLDVEEAAEVIEDGSAFVEMALASSEVTPPAPTPMADSLQLARKCLTELLEMLCMQPSQMPYNSDKILSVVDSLIRIETLGKE